MRFVEGRWCWGRCKGLKGRVGGNWHSRKVVCSGLMGEEKGFGLGVLAGWWAGGCMWFRW